MGADNTQLGSHQGWSFYTASLEHETYFVAYESTVSQKEVTSLHGIWGPITLSHDHINLLLKMREHSSMANPWFTLSGTTGQGRSFASSVQRDLGVCVYVFLLRAVTFSVEPNSPQ